ncbi:MAG: SpoIIE family protein phosphatase [bacterium]
MDEKELNELLLLAIEQSPASIMITDVKGNIEYVNPHFCSLTGYKREEIIGENPRIFKTTHYSSDDYKDLWKKIGIGQEWVGEFYNKKKNGEFFWESAKISPVINEKGEIINYIKIAEDISKEKAIKEDLEQSRKQLEKYNQQLILSNKKYKNTYRKYTDEIKKAAQLHTRFLPANLPELQDYLLGSYYKPAVIIGGDFYNFIRVGDKLISYIVDISGHGLDGAILNIFLRETINSFFMLTTNTDEIDPRDIIEYIFNKYSQENFPNSYFICIMLGVLDIKKGNFIYANCGIQVPAILLSRKREIEIYDDGWLPISSLINYKYYRKENIPIVHLELKEGDTIFFATDGLVEEETGDGIFGFNRVKEILTAKYFINPQRLINKLNCRFKNECGKLQGKDDITMIALQKAIEWQEEKLFSATSNLENIEKIKQALLDFIRKINIDQEKLLIGFHEILVNSIEHGNQFNPEKEIEIRYKKASDRIYIEIEDQGEGFNWQAKLLDCQDIYNYQKKKRYDRGRGIFIALQAFDDIYYNSRGNVVKLLKVVED